MTYDLLRARLGEWLLDMDLAAAGLRLRLLAGDGERDAGVRLRLRPRLSERALLRLRLRLQMYANASGDRRKDTGSSSSCKQRFMCAGQAHFADSRDRGARLSRPRL